MTSKLVTIAPDDTLSQAANLLRQYQFHHLPVVRTEHSPNNTTLLLEGILTSSDIDLAVALSKTSSSGDLLHRPWQEKRVAEVMHRAIMRVTPTTSVAAAAQILVDRGLNYLPVVEYEQTESETRVILVGLLTRSDLLVALARSLGAYEPGMQLVVALPSGDLGPLIETLRIASELHIQIRSVIAAPMDGSFPRVATLRVGTINPAPLLVRLREENIEFSLADPLQEGNRHV